MQQTHTAQKGETKTVATATAATKDDGIVHNPKGSMIRLLVKENPKKQGSASRKRFDLYKDGMSVEAYKKAVADAGQPKRLAADDLNWDVKHKFIAFQ